MIKAPIPTNEADRLADLRALNLLDTPSEKRFDHLTELAARIFNVPIAYIALVDADRQWFKAKCGLTTDETGREISFCGHTILSNEPTIIPDTTKDERFADNPLVLDDPNVRFYAGLPLAGPNGFNIGTLCIADTEPWAEGRLDLETFQRMGELANRELNMLDLIQTQKQLIDAKSLLLRTREQLDAELSEASLYIRSLLPEPLTEGPVRTNWTYESCSELGGDLLGYNMLDEHEMAIYVVDVMGHGVGAALHGSAIHSVLRHQSLEACDFRDPLCVYKSLDHRFPMEKSGGRFFTMFYGVLDIRNGTLRYVNGGHPPPIITGGFGLPRRLETTATIVGIGLESPPERGETVLRPGEELWIYSDAAIELNDQSGRMFGVEGFIQAISAVRAGSGTNPTDELRDLLSSVSGKKQFEDDLSLMRLTLVPAQT